MSPLLPLVLLAAQAATTPAAPARPAAQKASPARPAPAPAQRPSPEVAEIAARALALQREGQLDEAAAEYRRLLALVPKAWEARSNLGVIEAQRGRFDAAVAEYREALKTMPPAAGAQRVAVRYNLALALYKAVRIGEAAAELETLLKEQPGHKAAPLLLADCRLQLGEWKQVIAILDPLLERDPENKAILYMLGTALTRDRQYERGQRVIDRILRQGDSAEAHLLLAIASREANDDISAEKELRRALELDPQLPTANGLLGSVLVRMGEAPQAMEALRRELAINPNDFESRALLGLLLRQDSQNDAAMAEFERALTLRPNDPGIRYQVALVRLAQSRLDDARQLLEALVAESPSFTEAHVSLAMTYYRLGRRADGDRHQKIVQQLKREQQEREDRERERQGAPPLSTSTPPPGS